MTDVLELSSCVLSSILKQNLKLSWVFEICYVVDFAVDHNPTAFLCVMMKNLFKLFKNFYVFVLGSSLSHF